MRGRTTGPRRCALPAPVDPSTARRRAALLVAVVVAWLAAEGTRAALAEARTAVTVRPCAVWASVRVRSVDVADAVYRGTIPAGTTVHPRPGVGAPLPGRVWVDTAPGRPGGLQGWVDVDCVSGG